MEQLKTDTQKTKKKVLGGNTSENLFEFSFLGRAYRAETTKRFAFAPTVLKYVVKKISEFQVVRKW